MIYSSSRFEKTGQVFNVILVRSGQLYLEIYIDRRSIMHYEKTALISKKLKSRINKLPNYDFSFRT